jgi:hypothetical protein
MGDAMLSGGTEMQWILKKPFLLDIFAVPVCQTLGMKG